jgi:hypothetical protein
MGQTLVLDSPQKIVLEEGLDPCVLERLAVRVLLSQSPHVLVGQQPGGEVLGVGACSGFRGAARVGGGGLLGGRGIMRELWTFVLRRIGSRTALSIHDEIAEDENEGVRREEGRISFVGVKLKGAGSGASGRAGDTGPGGEGEREGAGAEGGDLRQTEDEDFKECCMHGARDRACMYTI